MAHQRSATSVLGKVTEHAMPDLDGTSNISTAGTNAKAVRAATSGSRNTCKKASWCPKAKDEKGGAHRKHREAAALVGMMVHQDGSTHEWIPGEL